MISLGEESFPNMTPEKMLTIIGEMGSSVEVDENVVTFEYQSISITLVYDLNADRMRLISPIAKVSELNRDVLAQALEANFHTALDARYCIGNDIVWSAFIHPLSELTERFFQSAIRQVAAAAATFGDQFSSGELYFNG